MWPHCFGGCKPQIKNRKDWFLVSALFLHCRWPPSYYILTWPFLNASEWRAAFLVSFSRRALILSDQGPALMISFKLSYVLRASIYKYSQQIQPHWGLGFQHRNWRGTQTFSIKHSVSKEK